MARRGRRNQRMTKDRVLQARIPENLDEEIRGRAEQLGLSVSTVVRNVLLHTFDLVEGVVVDSAQIAQVIHDRKISSAPPVLPAPDSAEPGEPASVLAWQEAILNLNGVCEQCNAILAKGEKAAIGLPVQARPVLLCCGCLAELSMPDASSPDSD